MTLDDDLYRSSADMVREAAADDERRAWHDWLADREQDEYERSGAQWARIFTRQQAEQPAVHYEDRPGYDRRLFAVDGDLAETARRDTEQHDLPGWVA